MPLQDDPDLLEAMLEDMRRAHPLYQPTQYWQYYFDPTVAYLKKHGLNKFRSESGGILSTFGATDLHPLRTCANAYAHLEEDKLRLHQFLDVLEVAAQFPDLNILPFDLSLNDLDMTAYRISALQGKACGAQPLEMAEASLVGDPEYYFTVEGRTYTHSFLFYYWRYCYCCLFCDFNKIDTIVELGPGAGKQVEVIKKLHPHLTFYLLDLAPQLYVCSQYLRALFPDCTLPYSTLDGPKGAIHILGSWEIEQLSLTGKTLFWSAASFGEMEPSVVENYLRCAKPWAQCIYLNQCMSGKEQASAGRRGVISPTRFEHYAAFLQDTYSLVDRSIAFGPLKQMKHSGGYEDAFWMKSKN